MQNNYNKNENRKENNYNKNEKCKRKSTVM